ncbi:MAG: hypothetical protein ACJAQS_000996 [Porticoccus sp.]|jgi:hypothetical protein
MSTQRHGLSIGIERINSDFFLTFKATGKLTHKDYETITPMINSALAGVKQAKIKALVDCIELEGWELRAAWDDLKLGLKHGNQFMKIAIIGNKRWQEVAAKIGTWLVAGEMEFFDNEETALDWLST